ncbi:uncharacterized protein PITG_16770 [Phytophthora infestans T30-4]|uniref:WD domain-containing protein n=1 Tax=Phytophthora infestans (strain T30-4) TaxID=403677 RepID=D0NUV2_PHYIT|nr:uncharacterized protein PITG_16770 [Phytophthora infestans T30-4]EEY65475.1 conserved hypothetical protein [Phytophthora infestans T30-4]|eukprot:XP_002897104.1 conserved hypothetical protein [Phytophthora infestans T30-4]
MSRHRACGGSSSRYANSGAFSIPDSDFQRSDTMLKRRRQLSPPRAVASASRRSAMSDGTITMRARSKSKSRARAMARKTPGQEFIALGSNRAASATTLNSNKASSGRRNLSPISTRTRSKSVTREKHDTEAAIRRSQRERSKSAARRTGGAPRSSRKESTTLYRASRTQSGKKRERGSSLQEIEDAIADTEQELEPKKKDLEDLKEQLKKLQKRVESKSIEVYDLQVELDALKMRRERRLPSRRSGSSREDKTSRRSRNTSKSNRRDTRRSSSHPRASKRPCIVDEDDEGSDDDDCAIIDSSEAKQELENSAASVKSTVVPVEDSMPDLFWGRSNVPKLLANHRFRAIPDGSSRKGRHLAFNPIQPQIFATSPDEGGLILWSYQRQDQDIAKVVALTPPSFRRDNPCAEAISWSPDGNRMAMAFRDPLQEKGEFCIVQLHQLKLEDSDMPQPIPRDRITSKRTVLHSRGISAIDWLPTGFGAETTSHQLVTTGNSDHAVVLWEEHEDSQRGGLDLKFTVLHRDHRSEVKSLCVHSQRDSLYTGGLDGLLIRYDLKKGCSDIVMERRKPSISKINAVLEHPHNPNLLMVSSVEQSRHNLLMHDLRQRYDRNGMSLTWEGSSMSQYVVPRWSPAGYHVSCGSKTGVVNIWDVRMRGKNYPAVLPQQSLRVHHKTVLHATWHPRYDAMFSVSHDRTLGLLTFR